VKEKGEPSSSKSLSGSYPREEKDPERVCSQRKREIEVFNSGQKGGGGKAPNQKRPVNLVCGA